MFEIGWKLIWNGSLWEGESPTLPCHGLTLKAELRCVEDPDLPELSPPCTQFQLRMALVGSCGESWTTAIPSGLCTCVPFSLDFSGFLLQSCEDYHFETYFDHAQVVDPILRPDLPVPRRICSTPCGTPNPNCDSGVNDSCSTGGCSTHPIRYATGEIVLEATDLISSGYAFPWKHTRSFHNRLTAAMDVGNGTNWQVDGWPYLAFPDEETLVLMGDPSRNLWFDKVGDDYVARFGLKDRLEFQPWPQLFRLIDLEGTVTEFHALTGSMLRRVDTGGNEIKVVSFHSNRTYPTVIERAVTAGGQTVTEQFVYDYNADDRLTSVTLRRKIGSGAWTNITRATYTYYGTAEEHGSEGDLETVTTQVWNNSQWNDTGTTYYRYWVEAVTSSSSSSGGGEESLNHLLKYVVNPAAFQRMLDDEGISDPLTATDLQVSLYADHYFEYDELRRVSKEAIQGGTQEFTFAYAESEFEDDPNAWKTRTTETLPDGSRNIVYSNHAAQTMLKIFQADEDEWYTYQRYDGNYRLILQAESSAVSGYDEEYADLLHLESGDYEYLRDEAGLIRTYTYHGPTGFLTSESLQEGELGDSIRLREFDYIPCCQPTGGASSGSSCGAEDALIYFLSSETVYPSDTNQTLTQVTSYAYIFYPGTCQVQQKVTTLPEVATDQNGSGVPATRREYFDSYGNLTWTMDERGFLTRNTWHVPTGTVTQQIQDVDTAQVTDEPSGWSTPSGGGLHLITDLEYDDKGRIIQTLGPVHSIDLAGTATSIRQAAWFVYQDNEANKEVWTAQGYQKTSDSSFTLVNPVSITKTDNEGRAQEQIQAVRSSTSGKLTAGDSFPQSSYVRWSTTSYTDCCHVAGERRYHTIPASGAGSEGTNYDETVFGYDVRKRRNRSVTPGGTITRLVFDPRGLTTAIYVGTDDTGATSNDPNGGGATGNNMVLITEHEYDNGTAGGDGNLTETTQHVDGSTTRVTSFVYDWRNRRTDTDGEVDYFARVTYDNLNRVTKSERYDTTGGGDLIARSETKYDSRGRVFRTIRYAVDPDTGTVGNALTDNTWYDDAGHAIKSLPSGARVFTKTVYDGLGRTTRQCLGYDLDETTYAEAETITGDTLLEQSETTYDAAGNVIQTTQKMRYHNATGTGELGTPASTQPKARVTYSTMYPDALGRTRATADYGTNGGSTLSRPDTIPTRSDTVLVSSLTYNNRGETSDQTDPAGIITCRQYDHRGRQTAQIMNCVASSSSSAGGGDCLPSLDENVTIQTVYNADGNVESITAVNSLTGNQTTQYVYGTTLADSGIATSILKRAEIYPDSDDLANPLGNGSDTTYDRIEFNYNRQREVTQIKDQQGTIHEFNYDLLGRQTQDRVTTLGSGVDGAVRRIATQYEVRGMKTRLTSYDNATVGSGSVVNEVQYVYNDFGQVETEYQSHSGAVNTSTTPKVQYGYASGSANTIRQTSQTYPDGRVITYDYGSSNGTDDVANRVFAIVDDDGGSTHLAEYQYLGAMTFVETDYTEPDVQHTLVGTAGGNDPDTGDIYRGLDRFGRVKDSYWYDSGSSADLDRIQYGYDRAGNRTYRENTVAASHSQHFDELYGYDLLHRLKDLSRGDLNGLKTVISSQNFAECWSLDEAGNWSKYLQDTDGNGTWNLNQSRTANAVNEISDITESAGPSWATPVYNRAGNMTTLPKPSNPTQSYAASYDGWNRLVKLQDGANTVSEYVYDGAKRRVLHKVYASGSLDETRHLYYNHRWQWLEQRNDSSSDANRQFIWGRRYIDDLIFRDRDAKGNGSLDERLYALQDVNWNVTALVDESGAVQERYAYTAYGQAIYLDGSFGSRGSSAVEPDVLFAGYVLDREISLYNVRNRGYHPGLGVWVQRDPAYDLHEKIGQDYRIFDFYEIIHTLRYSNSKPTRIVDPLGLGLVDTAFEFFFDVTGTGDLFLSATGGEDYTTLDCTGECTADILGYFHELLAATTVLNMAGGSCILFAPSAYTPLERLRQTLPIHLKPHRAFGQARHSTSGNAFYTRLPKGWRPPSGAFKWVGRVNLGLILVEGVVSMNAAAYCGTLCASMPDGWRYDSEKVRDEVFGRGPAGKFVQGLLPDRN